MLLSFMYEYYFDAKTNGKRVDEIKVDTDVYFSDPFLDF